MTPSSETSSRRRAEQTRLARSRPSSALTRTHFPKTDTTRSWPTRVRFRNRPVSPPRFARALITEEGDGGELNVGPALSADGTHVAFLSERDRLSIDIYLADATTGQIKTKLSETASDPHYL
jgi:hypothetical protein